MKKFFISAADGRLRAAWRILAFMVIFMAITAVGMIGVRTILGSLQKNSVLQWSILLITATSAIFIARRYLDKKPLLALGRTVDKYAVLDIFSGIMNSALTMAGMYFAMLWANLIEFHGFTWWTDEAISDASIRMAAIPIVLAVVYKLSVVAWWEELAFRGYILQNMIEGMGLKWSIIVSSLVFGFGHAVNPEASILSSVLIAVITPQLIYAYLKTGQLWLPIGLHLGWNFFQASIFGFAASGQHSPSLISQSPIGPDWLSGGSFGAEGSVLVIPFTLLSCFLIHYWVRATRQPGQRLLETIA
jgi:membrane protease YdiL (CAAX protease family)